MTVRTAELLLALLFTVFSAYLMWKSSELYILWRPGLGPGGGAWPFWLGLGMLLCCLTTLWRWLRRVTPESRSLAAFIDHDGLGLVAFNVVGLLIMLLLIHVIGTYFALFLFLIVFVRFVGGHSWATTISLAIALPVASFFFFEGALKILLPKAYSEVIFVELGLYNLIY